MLRISISINFKHTFFLLIVNHGPNTEEASYHMWIPAHNSYHQSICSCNWLHIHATECWWTTGLLWLYLLHFLICHMYIALITKIVTSVWLNFKCIFIFNYVANSLSSICINQLHFNVYCHSIFKCNNYLW